MHPDDLLKLLAPACERLGIKLKLETDYLEGTVFKVSVPQKYARGTLNLDELALTYRSPAQVLDSVLQLLESLQQRVYNEMYKQLEKKDLSGKTESLMKIAKHAVAIARQYISPDREEHRCLEHYDRYLESLSKEPSK